MDGWSIVAKDETNLLVSDTDNRIHRLGLYQVDSLSTNNDGKCAVGQTIMSEYLKCNTIKGTAFVFKSYFLRILQALQLIYT
jgi:hypothetical protein